MRIHELGVTITELIIVLSISGILLVSGLTISLYFYGDTIKSNLHSRLAVESQNLLRSIVEELRVSSGIRSSNTIVDPHGPGGGWTTSNTNLVLIISMPVLDTNNNFVIDSATGDPYQNEIVYFAQGTSLYKRYLAHPSAPGNRFKTSCPEASATAMCPADVKLTNHFNSMNFVFYDQDDIITTVLADARSIKLTINMKRQTFGGTLEFSNNIRITLRNSV